MQLYTYAANNPLRFIDPQGLEQDSIDHNTPTYFGFEGHFVLGGGFEWVTCCNGNKKIIATFFKTCFGAGFGFSGSGGAVFNVPKSNDCAKMFKGWTSEFGYGPLEVSVSSSKGPPVAVGAGYGIGGKATLCYYFLLHKVDAGCCQ